MSRADTFVYKAGDTGTPETFRVLATANTEAAARYRAQAETLLQSANNADERAKKFADLAEKATKVPGTNVVSVVSAISDVLDDRLGASDANEQVAHDVLSALGEAGYCVLRQGDA